MKQSIMTAAVLLILGMTQAAFANDIYKWTDKDGNVHFGDRPEGFDIERLEIESKATDPARVQAELQARADTRAQAAEADDDDEDASSEGEAQAGIQDRAERCADSRTSLQQVTNSRRMYREDEAGERVYLDEEEMQAARERVADQVDEYCDP